MYVHYGHLHHNSNKMYKYHQINHIKLKLVKQQLIGN